MSEQISPATIAKLANMSKEDETLRAANVLDDELNKTSEGIKAFNTFLWNKYKKEFAKLFTNKDEN